jgi:hypothetical protein
MMAGSVGFSRFTPPFSATRHATSGDGTTMSTRFMTDQRARRFEGFGRFWRFVSEPRYGRFGTLVPPKDLSAS